MHSSKYKGKHKRQTKDIYLPFFIPQQYKISIFDNFSNNSTMDIQENNELPISKYRQQIVSLVRQNDVTIICGQTGCGKTTQVPQYLFHQYQNIMISQPRRISAITLAQRVSQEMQVKIGEQIGYSVRFQEKRSPSTKLTFVTDGMAIRELMIGRTYDIFILDQAHERSINTDVLMAILKNKLKKLEEKRKRKEKNVKTFKLVIMSATIQSSKFMNFFNTESIARVEGRTYPTKIYNLLQPTESYLTGVYNTVLQIHYKEEDGDILAFLTGQDQILTLSKKLKKAISDYNIQNIQILMLYSALPHEYQHAIFHKNSEAKKRRIILSTNIAQTSVTISGLRYVVDCGFMKVRIYDSRKYVDILAVVPISKANALQRAGRAGRQADGKCYQMYIKNDFEELQQQTVPQILRSQLSGPILQLKAIGVPLIKSLQFMDQPSQQTIDNCLTLLFDLQCLNNEERVTEYGLQVSRIPLPPILSHLLIQSYTFNCCNLMLNVLSILSIDNLFYTNRQDKESKHSTLLQVMKKYIPIISGSQIQSDHLTKANILHQYEKSTNKKLFCKNNYVNKNNIKRAILIRDQLKDYLKQIIKERKKKQFIDIGNNNKKDSKNQLQSSFTLNAENVKNWLQCMKKCSVNTIAKLNKNGCYTISKSGQNAYIHPQSLCFYTKPKPSQIVFYQVVKTNKLYLRDISVIP